jgi:hypothetical protein
VKGSVTRALVAAIDQADRGLIDADLGVIELRTSKQAAKIVLALSHAQIDVEVRVGRLFEVNDDAQDL